METIQVYSGFLQHPKKYALTGIYVSKEYLKENNLTVEQYRDLKIKEYYENKI